MVYRLWLVWHRKWLIAALPICTYFASVVCGAMSVYQVHRLTPNENLFELSSAPWFASTLTCTIATSGYCSALISYKIWSTQRAVRRAQTTYPHSTTTSRIVAIVIEGALLFTASNATVIITYFSHSFAMFTCMDIATPLTGLAFCLIRIVRFGLGGTFEADRPMLHTLDLRRSEFSRSNASRIAVMEPVAIKDATIEAVAKTPRTNALHHPQTHPHNFT
ncbi:uncharacterized protein PHACADRAFT_167724 [Phanerochaete carnosa HHB-10118-sp]|uniref:Uncharacterized protein n=1 Tax=Phanerochaete carnosa (strain HHB-10118-sp) TaxID=650164 RepID=K5WMG4_PHACS|nr:uncharacterized protein PHACADRAFT_167724 [Phanerochaete carnosa HHB-10118-sp]EKM60359.1 hypothetical protein PHACADRAFT_167724 [Phanerochaete carnosa HHB-10118-sp]